MGEEETVDVGRLLHLDGAVSGCEVVVRALKIPDIKKEPRTRKRRRCLRERMRCL